MYESHLKILLNKNFIDSIIMREYLYLSVKLNHNSLFYLTAFNKKQLSKRFALIEERDYTFKSKLDRIISVDLKI